MKWLRSFLGIDDKKQAERSKEVSAYVHDKKNKFQAEQLHAQLEAKKSHKEAMNKFRQAVKIREIVDDVTAKIAVATGGIK